VDARAGTSRRHSGRRDAILNAALELFAKQGYQATGIDEIGAAAGVSGPAIYRHFGSKQDLLAAAFARTLDVSRERIAELLTGAETPAEKLETFVRATVHTALDDRLLLALYTREVGHLPRTERKSVQRKHSSLVGDVAALLREVQPSLDDEEARFAVLAIISLIGTVGFTDAAIARDRLEDMLVEMSLAALDAASAGA
jgi:AcrR family transcriptional regulator